jgi:hypothetical protein
MLLLAVPNLKYKRLNICQPCLDMVYMLFSGSDTEPKIEEMLTIDPLDSLARRLEYRRSAMEDKLNLG